MVSIRNVQGLQRQWFLLRLKLTIFLHFLPLLLRRTAGSALTPKRFIQFLRRLLLFLSKLDHNKFVQIGATTRMDLYVPCFPTPAFYAGCQKFLHFDEPLPCVTVLISVTSACRFSCPHCYQRHDRGHDVPLDLLLPIVRKLQDRGMAFFNIEGGEPFLVFDRLKTVCAAIDQRSEVWVNSTGDGMTLERLRELKQSNLTAIMFSLHTANPTRLNSFMGSDKAWESLTRGVDLCHQADVPVAFNACLSRDDYYDGEFERVMDQARKFNGCLIQLIKPKSAGAWLDSGPPPFRREDLDHVTALVRRYNHSPAYAAYPAISAQILVEDATRFGCTAGGTDRFYLNAKGDVQPCEFLNLSFGNIADEDFDTIYARMRQAFSPAGETWLCEACSGPIAQLCRSRGISNLPLSKDLSRQICEHWDRGKPTRLYERMGALK
jgi:radical SAM protein with 4Fe4S-binding SPASM domain